MEQNFVPDELADYDYDLPESLIARHPLPDRETARLLVVDRAKGTFEHRHVYDLPELLNSGDTLVLNDTRVLPARLFGRRRSTGGRWEGLFLEATPGGTWRMMGQTRGKLQPGEQLVITPTAAPQSSAELILQLIETEGDGVWRVRPVPATDAFQALEEFGAVPLPPYMDREQPEADDVIRYQTTYARHPGSVAAPTAGLHFTPKLLSRCRAHGIYNVFVTLHVGIGTFRPIAAERLGEHRMHSEWCELPAAAAAALDETRGRNGRIVAVGTTSARTLETAARTGVLAPWSGTTDLFVRPPYRFRAVDVLLTNFHLPRSTLLVLVCTFADHELIHAAYAEAIRQAYRFYSYGDAMLIL